MNRSVRCAICAFLVIVGATIRCAGSGPTADRDDVREKARDLAPAAADGKIDLTEPGIVFDHDDTVILEELEAILLLPPEESGDAMPETSGVVENRVSAPPEAIKGLERYLGKEVSLGILNQLMRAIVLGYRDAGLPVVDVFFPEQDITDGVVRIYVVEGKLGEIRVEGAERANQEDLMSQVGLKTGEQIRSEPLEDDLRWLNGNYFRSVGLVYQAGEEIGATDLILKVDEFDAFRVYSGIANTGVELTGENEWSAGLLWGDVLGSETMLTYGISRDLDFESLISQSGYARTPLPWRHYVEFFAAHLETNAQFPLTTGTFLDVGGSTTQAGFGYVIPLSPIIENRVTHSLTFGADYTSTNNDLSFGGATVINETAAILQGRAEYEASVTGDSSRSDFMLGAVFSPGNLIGNNDDSSFSALRSGADPEYFYLITEIEHTRQLPWFGLEAAFDFVGQWSNDRLLSNEQLLIGGYTTVRGFGQSVLRGDHGIVASAELNLPDFSVPMPIKFDKKASLQPYLFCDYGWIDVADPTAGETSETLSSTGAGIRYTFGDHLSARAEYGWGIDYPDYIIETSKFHFSMEVRF
ncbi:MAG: hemolysin activation/secretion protein [Verrucomicrobiales bacterium]|jgi:hemolysin activation/secretion protein